VLSWHFAAIQNENALKVYGCFLFPTDFQISKIYMPFCHDRVLVAGNFKFSIYMLSLISDKYFLVSKKYQKRALGILKTTFRQTLWRYISPK